MMQEKNQSLYTPELEHDACGIGFVAHLKGEKSHENVTNALKMLVNMEHRGGCGCEKETGDGAGILIQVPDEFFREECPKLGIHLPEFGKYGVGMTFLPRDPEKRALVKKLLNEKIDQLDLELLGYRIAPTSNKGIGRTALSVEPTMEQFFVVPKADSGIDTEDKLERRLCVLRKFANRTIHQEVPYSYDDFYIATCSYKVIVYKGQLRTDQVEPYYLDLQDERVKTAIALVHSRFSTNTTPKWKLAQPFRFIAHNGEINTVRGNVNWMRARQPLLKDSAFTEKELELIQPLCDTARSDSSNLDNAVEILHLGGRSLAHTMMMLVPEAWQDNDSMEQYKKDFYEFHASIMEPWDGPASICFTDGKIVGATLDRNGLRPSRYCVTSDDMLIMASETGALPGIDPAKIVKKGRLQPGKIFVADLEQGRIISDDELKKEICQAEPYGEWLKENKLTINDLPEPDREYVHTNPDKRFTRQQAFGYTSEDLKTILADMVSKGTEPLGSMGADTPLPILSDQSQHLSNYFKQLFAQVTNPPIDPIREKMVMSLYTQLGSAQNMFGATPAHCKQIHLDQPVLTNKNLDKLRKIDHPDYKSLRVDILFPAKGDKGDLEAALDKICMECEDAVRNGVNILILSDRAITRDLAPIPSLLATGAVHHHLIRSGLRANAGIVVRAGDVVETHHFATLIGYGANAVNPYLAFETIASFQGSKFIPEEIGLQQSFDNYNNAIGYGLRKIMSKMGISTLQSYHGAQIFEALGIGEEVIEKCFKTTISRIGGLDFDGIAKEVLVKHDLAFPDRPITTPRLNPGGVYQWKRKGEFHLFNPETIHLLQDSTKKNDYVKYKKYAEAINDQSERACTLRGLLDFKKRTPISIDEVEPKEEIFKRFATGAMSFGSISFEAHTTLAIAMNRIGGKSNSGEGGEDEIRFKKEENGDWMRSAIKQVASGRFGVTSNYLTNCEEIQIKMAQGAKPGEGGQLPGHKVDDWIGRVRHSTPGVGLISPPPHHDIYSIEDLAQLIFDLKNANREARINVKLVSEAGVGTIAAGVAKAKADVVLISGADGGTGASPLTSIRHAGLPWELGLAETHQTLVRNDLRSRIVVQTDGQIRTGRDLAIATLLGAEEWGVATAALVVEGCIMMRKCHLNTCPVGIATQDKELRKLFSGDPAHVVNFFHFLAEDLREIMAELGFRTVDEMVGQANILKKKDNIENWKFKELDLRPVLYKEPADVSVGLYCSTNQDHELEGLLDWKMIEAAQPALKDGTAVKAEFDVVNTDRTIGTMLSNEVSKIYGSEGLPDKTISFHMKGSAGQSFGGFMAKGIFMELEGDSNDYFGKGLSGGKLAVYPDATAPFAAEENILIGNVAFFGATSGEGYVNGIAGERFCVRNSGAKVVVEGIGDHGCEYMTGGTAVILGETGRNFAAGMSGGVAYVYDPGKVFEGRCNMGMVDLDPMDLEDISVLKEMIGNHKAYTGSNVAEKILSNWDTELSNFVKVMPRDYKAVLAKKKQEASPEAVTH